MACNNCEVCGKVGCLVGRRNSDSVLRRSGVQHSAQDGYRLLRPTDCALRVVAGELPAAGLISTGINKGFVGWFDNW